MPKPKRKALSASQAEIMKPAWCVAPYDGAVHPRWRGRQRGSLLTHAHTTSTEDAEAQRVRSIAKSHVADCGRSGARIASAPQFPPRPSPVAVFLLSRKILGLHKDSVRCARAITGPVLSFSHDNVLLGKQFWLETGSHRSWPLTCVVWQQVTFEKSNPFWNMSSTREDFGSVPIATVSPMSRIVSSPEELCNKCLWNETVHTWKSH